MSTFWQPLTTESSAPAIMRSLGNSLEDSDKLSDFNIQYYRNKTFTMNQDGSCTKCNNNYNKSFLLLNGQEKLQIPNIEEFLKKLDCIQENTRVKVVSIFGNTGDGKTHIMNHVFFKGEEIFQISNNQNCCILGVWAAFDPVHNVICLDTEGLQGIIVILYIIYIYIY